MIRAALLVVVVSVMLLATSTATAGTPPGQKELLQRLFAPCCYRETLDMHVSPMADELKFEIQQRLAGGESPDAIAADLVQRFGERILTRPPRPSTSLAIFAGVGLAAASLIGLALRRTWRQPPQAAFAGPQVAIAPGERHGLEDRLDDELDSLD